MQNILFNNDKLDNLTSNSENCENCLKENGNSCKFNDHINKTKSELGSILRKQNIVDFELNHCGQEFLYHYPPELFNNSFPCEKEKIDLNLLQQFLKELKQGQFNSFNLHKNTLIKENSTISNFVNKNNLNNDNIIFELLEEELLNEDFYEVDEEIFSNLLNGYGGKQNIEFALDDFPVGTSGQLNNLSNNNYTVLKIDLNYFQEKFDYFEKKGKLKNFENIIFKIAKFGKKYN